MHFGLVAVKAPLDTFREAFTGVWPRLRLVATATNFLEGSEIWRWMESNEKFVAAAAWTPTNRGTQTALFCQDGPWAIFMDKSYTLVSDEEALKKLSLRFGTAISFVVETAGGCALFWCYENGGARRVISSIDGTIDYQGEPLPEEVGIPAGHYYMAETEALISAFGLTPLEDLPVAATTVAVALEDMTDYSPVGSKVRVAPETALASSSPSASSENSRATPRKSWWRFW
jgi:hypothetical protein